MSSEKIARAWMEIRPSALRQNLQTLKRRVGERCRIIPMVKADGYGLGVEAVTRSLEPLDPYAFGVATAAEALRLRELGITRPVVIFSPLDPQSIPIALAAEATVAISDPDSLERICEEARGRTVRFHVEIDTGMGRAGLDPERMARWAHRMRSLESSSCVMEGCFTHFHSAEDDDEAPTRAQLAAFEQAVEALLEGRTGPAVMRHVSNSAAALRFDMAADAIRPGIFLYGGRIEHGLPAPRPVVSVHARVIHTREAAVDATLGYGATHRAQAPEIWATLGIGYGDGLPRSLGNRGSALVGGRRVPIIGRISMDMTVVDITDVPGISVGDRATLLGSDGDQVIDLEEMAETAGTISYEILTGFTARLPRVWVEDERDTAAGAGSPEGG